MVDCVYFARLSALLASALAKESKLGTGGFLVAVEVPVDLEPPLHDDLPGDDVLDGVPVDGVLVDGFEPPLHEDLLDDGVLDGVLVDGFDPPLHDDLPDDEGVLVDGFDPPLHDEPPDGFDAPHKERHKRTTSKRLSMCSPISDLSKISTIHCDTMCVVVNIKQIYNMSCCNGKSEYTFLLLWRQHLNIERRLSFTITDDNNGNLTGNGSGSYDLSDVEVGCGEIRTTGTNKVLRIKFNGRYVESNNHKYITGSLAITFVGSLHNIKLTPIEINCNKLLIGSLESVYLGVLGNAIIKISKQ